MRSHPFARTRLSFVLALSWMLSMGGAPSQAQAGCNAGSKPMAVADTVSFTPGALAVADLLANDTHPLGSATRIGTIGIAGCAGDDSCTATVPGVGTLSLELDGVFRFAAEQDFSGSHSITYSLVDARGCTSGQATVVLEPGVGSFGYNSGTSTTGPQLILGLTVLGTSEIQLDWNLLAGATGHTVERGDGAGGWLQIATPGAGTTTMVDTDLSPATAYCYRVTAQRAAGDVVSNDPCAATQTGGGDFAHSDALETVVGQRLLVDATADLLANDVGAVAVESFGPPSAGQLVEITDTIVVFAPPMAQSGPFTFTYTATNGAGQSDQATVTVTTVGAGDVDARDDDLSAFGNPATACLDDAFLLRNDGGTGLVRVAPTDGPYRGSLVPEPGGGWRYQHTGDGAGSDVFRYTVEDASEARARAIVLISLAATGNNPPIAVDDEHAEVVGGGTFVSVAVSALLANDFDPDCEPVLFVDVDSVSAAGASVSLITPAGVPTIVYDTPGSVPGGVDTFGYTIRDASGTTARGTFEIHVTPAGAPLARFVVACSSDPANLTCHFDGTASRTRHGNVPPPCTFVWELGDGTVIDPRRGDACQQTLDHTYAEAGAYLAKLTIYDPGTGLSSTVENLALPGTDGFQAAITMDCQAELTCTFDGTQSALPPGQPATYKWSLRNNLFETFQVATPGLSYQHTFPEARTWRVTLTIELTDFGQTSISNPISFFVDDQPPAAAFQVRCPQQGPFVCVLDGRDAGDDHGVASYQWLAGDGSPPITSTDAQVPHVFMAGIYNVSLTVVDGSGQSDTLTLSVNVPVFDDQPPRARFVGGCSDTLAGGSYPCLLDGGFSHDHDRSEPLLYKWLVVPWPEQPGSPGGFLQTKAAVRFEQTSADPLFAFAVPFGEYHASLLVRDGAGQWSESFVRRIDGGVLNISGDLPPLGAFFASCLVEGVGFRCTFDAAASFDEPDGSPTTYAWAFGDGATLVSTVPVVNHIYTAAGVYNATLVVTDSVGQSDLPYDRVMCVGCPNDPPPAVRLGAPVCDGRLCRLDGAWAADSLGRIGDVSWRLLHVESSAELEATGILPGLVELPASGLWKIDLFAVDLLAQATAAGTSVTVSQRPTLTNDISQGSSGQAQIIAVLINDSDPDGDSLTVVSIGTPAHGTASIFLGGTVRYQPDLGFAGTDRFTYTVSDGVTTATAEVIVTVSGMAIGF